MSFKDQLAAAKLPERAVTICLNGDLRARFDELERELRQAREVSPARVGESPELVRIAEEQEAIRQQMAGAMVTFKVRALPRSKWTEIRLRHRPDSDADEGDQALGVKLEPFMEEVIPLCVAEPEMDADDWRQLNDVLSGGEFDKLFTAVWDVNRSGVDIPKSRLASLVTRSSGEGSKPPVR